MSENRVDGAFRAIAEAHLLKPGCEVRVAVLVEKGSQRRNRCWDFGASHRHQVAQRSCRHIRVNLRYLNINNIWFEICLVQANNRHYISMMFVTLCM